MFKNDGSFDGVAELIGAGFGSLITKAIKAINDLEVEITGEAAPTPATAPAPTPTPNKDASVIGDRLDIQRQAIAVLDRVLWVPSCDPRPMCEVRVLRISNNSRDAMGVVLDGKDIYSVMMDVQDINSNKIYPMRLSDLIGKHESAKDPSCKESRLSLQKKIIVLFGKIYMLPLNGGKPCDTRILSIAKEYTDDVGIVVSGNPSDIFVNVQDISTGKIFKAPLSMILAHEPDPD